MRRPPCRVCGPRPCSWCTHRTVVLVLVVTTAVLWVGVATAVDVCAHGSLLRGSQGREIPGSRSDPRDLGPASNATADVAFDVADVAIPWCGDTARHTNWPVSRHAFEACGADTDTLQAGCLVPLAALHLGQAVATVLVACIVASVLHALCIRVGAATGRLLRRRRRERAGWSAISPVLAPRDSVEIAGDGLLGEPGAMRTSRRPEFGGWPRSAWRPWRRATEWEQAGWQQAGRRPEGKNWPRSVIVTPPPSAPVRSRYRAIHVRGHIIDYILLE